MSDPRPQRRTPRKKTPSLAPLYGAIGIAILAIVAVAMAQKDKDARSEAAKKPSNSTAKETSNPFADVPAGGKVVPSPFSSSSSKGLDPSATGLLEATVWTEAIATAERAKKRLMEAKAADRDGDRSTYKRKALEARELFHGALEATAQWESDISKKHGEEDSKVKTVRSLRNVWFDQRKKLRSVDVNDI
ncbi:MAG: hypothetical protein GY930_05290 [bacterium]|nr:hypothetical protein [bacterium]